jgi:protein-L-isoaspartate(D-aspartate) O-methyltransferase
MNQLTYPSPQDVMIQTQVIERGIRDARVVSALRATPRDKFFPGQMKAQAFADRAAPIGHGQTISQPYIVALMSSALDVNPDHRVLEIGTGSGYQTAILSKLAGEVFTVERVKPLLDTAWERLMDLNLRNIHYRFGDGTRGWPEQAPFDRILVTAAAPEIPQQLLLSQLKDDGFAVVPIGGEEHQLLTLIRRHGQRLETTNLGACRFVKLVGQEGWPVDDATAPR